MSFSEALKRLKTKEGYKAARKGWNGQGMYISLQTPDKKSKMSRPYLYMYTADKALVPWVASQSCLLAEDWYEVK